MATVQEQVQALVEPILVAHALELFDLEHAGGKLVISVDRPGGADVDGIASAARAISRALDAHDIVPGNYTLEVSSPGLERRLRTPRHFAWAVGRDIKVKLIPTVATDRRLAGVLQSVDESTGTILLDTDDADGPVTIAIADIDRARTVFEWGGADKPVSPSRANVTKQAAKKAAKKSGPKAPKTAPKKSAREKRATAT